MPSSTIVHYILRYDFVWGNLELIMEKFLRIFSQTHDEVSEWKSIINF